METQLDKVSVVIAKKKQEEGVNLLVKECGVFFAFSNQQFDENKTPLQEGEKYVDIGAGGFIPKSKLGNWLDGLSLIEKVFIDDIEKNNLRESYILYELNNHEAFYTGSIESTFESLVGEYTKDEVVSVYKKYKAEKYIN